MTKRIAIPFKETKLRVVGPLDNFYAHRIQRLDIPANIPNTVINELGNPKHAGIVTDIPEISSTFQAFDVSPKIFAVLTGTDPDAYPVSGVDVSNLGYCDLIVYVKEANVAEHLKCIHAKYMKITDFNFSYSVGGEATEEYTCAGSEKRYFANDVVVDDGTLVSGVNTNWLDYTPNTLKNGNKLLSLIVDEEWLAEGDDFSVNGRTITMVGIGGGDAQAVYHTSSNVMTWADISDATVPAAIRGKNIPITIGVENQYRVQSVNIRGTFPNTKVMEMGNTSVVGYITDVPDITGDISVLDTDNELISLLTTGVKSGADVEFGVDEYSERTSQLDIVIKDPADNTTVLKTLRIPAMRITSDGTSTNTGGQLTQNFSFSSDTAELIIFSGAAI